MISNGCDFDEFAGLEHTPSDRLRILHAGFFFGVRSPRPFLEALARLLADRPELREVIEARFVGRVSHGRSANGPSRSGWARLFASTAFCPTPRRSPP